MDRNIDVVRFYSVENEILFVYSTALERTLQPAAALICGAKPAPQHLEGIRRWMILRQNPAKTEVPRHARFFKDRR
jgi:hypothetical protein